MAPARPRCYLGPAWTYSIIAKKRSWVSGNRVFALVKFCPLVLGIDLPATPQDHGRPGKPGGGSLPSWEFHTWFPILSRYQIPPNSVDLVRSPDYSAANEKTPFRVRESAFISSRLPPREPGPMITARRPSIAERVRSAGHSAIRGSPSVMGCFYQRAGWGARRECGAVGRVNKREAVGNRHGSTGGCASRNRPSWRGHHDREWSIPQMARRGAVSPGPNGRVALSSSPPPLRHLRKSPLSGAWLSSLWLDLPIPPAPGARRHPP